MMPHDLVLVRHGQSEGNVAMHAARGGDLSHYTEAFVTTPGHKWNITSVGAAQAQRLGAWLTQEFIEPSGGLLFDRHYASPYVRTRQTAGHLGLQGEHHGSSAGDVSPEWMLNRALRERQWGDIGSIPTSEFIARPEYALNVRNKTNNPLYWVPPGGEAIADVAENRVRNFLDTLHREQFDRVLAVTHGETMMAFRLTLERLSDEDYETLNTNPDATIHNCGVLHYSRTGPDPTVSARHLNWVRYIHPVLRTADHRHDNTPIDPGDPESWTIAVGDWAPIVFNTYTNDTLLT